MTFIFVTLWYCKGIFSLTWIWQGWIFTPSKY